MIFSTVSFSNDEEDLFLNQPSYESFHFHFSDSPRPSNNRIEWSSFGSSSNFLQTNQNSSNIDDPIHTSIKMDIKLSTQTINKNDYIFKVRGSRTLEKSPYHNHQKHLNNALKKLIKVPESHSFEEDYRSAAFELWKKYLSLTVKTKKILHYIFNANNEFQIYNCELQKYGLLKLYRSYRPDILDQAKLYLSELAVNQLTDEGIDSYLRRSKMKNSAHFKRYLLEFKNELSHRYLKKRVTIRLNQDIQ